MNVVPAVWVGLFRLFTLSVRSTMSSTGPAARLSLASRIPPALPSSSRAALTAFVGEANGSRMEHAPEAVWEADLE